MTIFFIYLKNYKTNLILGPMFKLLEAIFELIVPLVMADIIDNGINHPNPDIYFILGRGGIIVLLAFVGLGSSLLCQYFASKCSQGFGTELRDGLFSHINNLSFSQIDKFSQSSLLTRLTSDINQLQVAVAMLIRLVIRAPFLVLGATVMAIIINWKLGLIFLAVAPILSTFIYLIMSKTIKYYATIQKKYDKINNLAKENLSGTRVVRAFSEQENQKQKFKNANEDITTNLIMVGKISALLSPISFILINLSIIAILFFGGGLVNSGDMTQGEIIAFINYLIQISLALVVVANIVILYTKSYAVAKRVKEVLEIQPDMNDGELTQVHESDMAQIEFENVAFGYNQDKLIIDNLNLVIYKGQSIGIIGGTGSGKSTLISLIARYYDVSSGSIKLYGKPLQQYGIQTLRSYIGIVRQRSELFSGTILSNLLLANENANDSQIYKALEIAQATDFVAKKDGKLNFVVKQNANNLSGGQKQRLSIARTLLADPKILILDDATSALDYLTESMFFKALQKQYGSQLTKIIVSQRVNTIKNCDKIIVMDKNQIKSMGTHSELIKNCETYKEFFYSQNSNEVKNEQ